MKKDQLREIKMIPIKSIRFSERNPNEMSEWEFAQLKEAIRIEGFDEPIKVVKDTMYPHEDRYVVISGEHRTRACDELGWEEIPAVIEEDWDETAANAYLVRRNLNRGHINSKKLRTLIETNFSTFTPEEAANLLGFETSQDMNKLAKIKEVSEFDPEDLNKIENNLNETSLDIEMIDGLQGMLHSIFTQYGTDVDKNFMAFVLNKKVQLLLLMNPSIEEKLTKLVNIAREGDLDLSEVFESLIESFLECAEEDASNEEVDSEEEETDTKEED